MNYRVLFFISFLILAMGLSGLFFMLPEESPNTPQQQTASEKNAPKSQISILIAQTTRQIPQGTLLQAEDYALSELTVDSDDARANFDLKAWLANNENSSLQGYLAKQTLQAGSFLSPDLLLSPQHPDYLLSSLDPMQEVAYRIYIKAENGYIFDTLRAGSHVSVGSQQIAGGKNNKERTELIKLVGDTVVLQSKIYGQDEKLMDRNIVGYISVKLNAQQLQKFYSLPGGANLILFPNNIWKQGEPNHRGIFIRKLRGQ